MHVPGVLFLVWFNNFDRTTRITRSSSNHLFLCAVDVCIASFPGPCLKRGGGQGMMYIYNSLALAWYWLMKPAMSNPSVGMVPSTDAWALSAGEEIQTACTTTVDGMTTLLEWKYWDLGNGSIEIWRMEVLRSGEWKYQDLGNRSIDTWGAEVSRSGK